MTGDERWCFWQRVMRAGTERNTIQFAVDNGPMNCARWFAMAASFAILNNFGLIQPKFK